jgi:glucan phosphorylase
MSKCHLKKPKKAVISIYNHTDCGWNDAFSADLMTVYFDNSPEVMILFTYLDMGRIQHSLFSMTMLGLRASEKSNAVSQYHANKAKTIWSNHPLLPITNGAFLHG